MNATGYPPLPISAQEILAARARALTRHRAVDGAQAVGEHVMRHASSRPDAIAVLHEAGPTTYAQLVRQVADVRHQLECRGCRPGHRVVVTGPRGATTVVLFLALESLRATYIPVDAAWPIARQQQVVRRSRADLVVGHGGVDPAVPAGIVPVLRIADAAPGSPDTGAPQRPGPGDVRYVIFTSGTTGMPKGACVEHRGMMNHLHAKVLDLGLTAADTVAFSAPLTFDISVWQMLAPLLVGGTVAVLPDADIAFPRRLVSALRRTRSTVAEFVPTVLDWIVGEVTQRGAALPDLRCLLSTGEELTASLAGRLITALPSTGLINAYGPTECSDDVTHHQVRREELTARLPVGRPVPNASLYVLCEQGGGWRAAARDEPGELFVGGLPVGPGYLEDREATSSAFFADVLDTGSPTGRLYKTGDAAVIHDGTLYYLGRLDRQVKIAGVRMELGEIEAILSGHPAVRQCAVVVDSSVSPPELVAYYVAAPGADDHRPDLVRALAARLPAAMIPHRWHTVAALPLSPNGKVDHRALGQFAEAPAVSGDIS